jgi:hypothetical protein
MASNPFAIQPTQFLESGLLPMPQAPELRRTGIPDMLMNQFSSQEPIDLGAGGPPPGSERANGLSSLGNMMQQIAPMIGAAMSPSAPKNDGSSAGAWSNPALGNQPNITAPQLGTPQNFDTAMPQLTLNPSAPRPLFKL